MSTILDELLKDIKEPEIDIQVKKICDSIYDEEVAAKRIDPNLAAPNGPNIFLVLPVKSISGYQEVKSTFLSLERESYGKFILGVWQNQSKDNFAKFIRTKVIDINETDVKRIIKRFAEQYKVMKGN